MKKFASIAAAFAALALVAPAAQAQSGAPQIDTGKTYRITTPWSLVVEVSGASRGDGAPIAQWPVNGGTHQQWRFEYLGAANHYRIRNVNSEKCLTSPGGSALPRTKLVQWVCGRAGQEWSVDWRGPSTNASPIVRLSLPGADAAVDVPENTPYWGTQLQLWPKSDFSSGQSFQLIPLV